VGGDAAFLFDDHDRSAGFRVFIRKAAASPTIPAPMTTTSVSMPENVSRRMGGSD
jgi:hypothetical protein